MALAMMMPIAHAIMWVGPGGHVGEPIPPRHGGPPINIPTMIYIPGGGGGGGGSGSGGTSTFSTPSGNGNGQPQAVVTEYSNGVVTQSTPYGTVGHGGVHVPVRATTTTSQSTSTPTVITKTITITKTYTQYIYDTYEVNHYIYEYMYPIIQWVFTLVNIGSQQTPGYHMVGSEKLFTPGFGGSGIFVPVYAQEAVYAYNIAPSTKPQITGWYTGKTSQSTSGPFLVSQSSTPPQLTGVQQAVDNAGQAVSNIQQLATSSGNGLTSKTYVYYGNGNININIVTYYTNKTGPTNSTTTQPPTGQVPWWVFRTTGPAGPNTGGFLGNTVIKYNNPGGPIVTYNPNVTQSYQQIWNQGIQVWSNAFQSLGNAISNTLDAIGSALTNVVTAPISILTGFTNAIDNAISNGLRAVNLP
jgi:hypothetical protein